MALGIATGLALALAVARGAPAIRDAPPPGGDPQVMALARRAVGRACLWRESESGPHIPGFVPLDGIGQTFHPEGAVILRRRGSQRVAFMARTDGADCRVLDARPLPPRSAREEFEQCRIEDPRPDVTTPLADGLGHHADRRRPITFFLEADFKAGRLVPRDPTGDRRFRCSGFESGD